MMYDAFCPISFCIEDRLQSDSFCSLCPSYCITLKANCRDRHLQFANQIVDRRSKLGEMDQTAVAEENPSSSDCSSQCHERKVGTVTI
uniref:Uncharacterized protein n=1 Tax=Noccaea caerulescens TaxID=107243 RepID=A0A1J3JVV3_NOCCA